MKLLIVDDEELTRTGLISSLDWMSLGIREIYQADDGINGLSIARLYHPEIILCDVRMPRMDGITMLEQLEKELPDTIPVFMSGYSDKEYLKAAIRLKAVTYIEKPLDPEEVREAIKEAQELYIQKARSRRAETMHSMENVSRLALLLTSAYEANKHEIHSLLQETCLPIGKQTFFTAFVAKLDIDLELIRTQINQIRQKLENYFSPSRWNVLFAEKRHQYLVYFLYGNQNPPAAFIRKFGDYLCLQHKALARCIITAGDICMGVHQAYSSYASAVILLQNCFFYPENTFYTATDINSLSSQVSDTGQTADALHHPEKHFINLLSEHNNYNCMQFLDTLYHFYEKNHYILTNQVKDTYYMLFLTLENTRRQQKMVPASSGSDSIMEALEKCFTFQDLHNSLVEQTRCFFDDARNFVPENPTIRMIKEFIEKNYANELLSVKDISEHVALSTSYLCTFFKNETGQTLNQYLTEYRMEKSKQLLDNPRYKIAEISSMVGYNDGNYFGKSFKKYTGLTPSEYREKSL